MWLLQIEICYLLWFLEEWKCILHYNLIPVPSFYLDGDTVSPNLLKIWLLAFDIHKNCYFVWIYLCIFNYVDLSPLRYIYCSQGWMLYHLCVNITWVFSYSTLNAVEGSIRIFSLSSCNYLAYNSHLLNFGGRIFFLFWVVLIALLWHLEWHFRIFFH